MHNSYWLVEVAEFLFSFFLEKYASFQQENDDLKRFIFQHFGVNLTPKPPTSNKPTGLSTASTVALPVVLNNPSGVQVVPVPSSQPILLKVVPAQPPAVITTATAEGGSSGAKESA